MISKIKFAAIFAVLLITCALWSPSAQASHIKSCNGYKYNYASKVTTLPLRGHHHKCHGKHHHHGHHHHHHHRG